MTLLTSAYGRVGADPIERQTKTNKRMVVARIACEVARYGQDSDTFWVGVVAFGATADVLARHAKGDTISVFGRMTRSKFAGADGAEREDWSINADQVVSARTARPGAAKSKKKNSEPATASALPAAADPDLNDEIGF